MSLPHIDYEQLINEIDEMLHDIPHKVDESRDGKVFTIQTRSLKAKLEITIESKWVGYDFGFENDSGGYQNDTDLYPLDFNTAVTMEIFEDLKVILIELLDHKVYAGRDNEGRHVIARPFNDREYEVKTYKDKTWWQKHGIGNTRKISYVPSKELTVVHPYLTSIK